MQVMEIAILILLIIMLIWHFIVHKVRSRTFVIFSLCTFFALVAHFFTEGWRWQMIPAYGVSAVMLIIAGIRFCQHTHSGQPNKKMRASLRITVFCVGILLVLVSLGFSWAIPVFRLSAPSGRHQIGFIKWFLVDESREEILTSDPDDHREINLYVWYPADASGLTHTTEYLGNSQIVGKAITSTVKGAGFFINYLRLIRTHSFTDAPVSDGESCYPVLIFSHGYGAHALLNTVLMEELASHGFIVFSIGHTYESIIEVFPDGRQAWFSPPPNSFDEETTQKLMKEAEELNDNDLEGRISFFRRFKELASMERSRIYVWSADTRFVIDWLEKINNEDSRNPFYQKLDLNRLGVFGMSFGGAAAGQTYVEDRRVKAVIDIDGAPYGDLIEYPLKVPFMFMSSEQSAILYNGLFTSVIDFLLMNCQEAAYDVSVMRSAHLNYTDASLWSPVLKYTGLVGKINGERMVAIVNTYATAFFEKHLKGMNSPLLNGPSEKFSEVIFKGRDKEQ